MCRSRRVSVVLVAPSWDELAMKKVLHQAKRDNREVYLVKVGCGMADGVGSCGSG